MTEISQLDGERNENILSGKALEGLEKFCSEDCVVQENTEPPTRASDP